MKHSVLHVTFWSDIRHRYGSVQKIMLTLASAAQAWRHDIACLGTVGEGDFIFEGVRCHPFWENRWKNRVFNKWLGLDVFTHDAVVDVVERLRPDVLHIHNRQDKVDALLARLSYRPGVVVHYHRDFPVPGRPCGGDRLLAPSRALADVLIAKGLDASRVAVAPNPLTRDLIDAARQRSDETFCRRGGGPVILYGGGNFEHKGLRDLLATQRLIDRPHELWLAGSGYDDIAPETGVRILGELGNEAFLEAIRQADVVVVPSHREAFGLVALETMLLERLLVASKVGGLEEVTGPDTAIQVVPGSVKSLAAGLEQALDLCDQPLEMAAILERARCRAEEFQPESIVAGLEAIYDEVLTLRA